MPGECSLRWIGSGDRVSRKRSEDFTEAQLGGETASGLRDWLCRQKGCSAGWSTGDGSAPACMTQGDESGFLAGLEGERLIELKSDSAHVAPGHHGTDPPGSDDTRHGFRVVETAELGNVKPNGQPLLFPKATSVDGTGKGKSSAGNIDHQTEKAGLGGILAEPHGPSVAESLFIFAV